MGGISVDGGGGRAFKKIAGWGEGAPHAPPLTLTNHEL